MFKVLCSRFKVLTAFNVEHRTMNNLFGGGERVRTDGLLRARQALSQLSYTPDIIGSMFNVPCF
jgi:hypothetical protein